MTNFTFIKSIPVLHAETSVPALYFSGHFYPRQVVRHTSSHSDVYETDLDMQMRFRHGSHGETLAMLSLEQVMEGIGSLRGREKGQTLRNMIPSSLNNAALGWPAT